MVKKRSEIFIVGTQRAGTTLLRLILNSHSQIAIPEEAEFIRPLLKKDKLKGYIQGQEYKKLVSYLEANQQFKLWNYDDTSLLNNLKKKDKITLKAFISLVFTSYASEEGKEIWGDKTPVFLRNINIFNKLFPEALFIHIVRDGRDVFDSWRKMDPTKDNVVVTAIDWCYKLFRIENSFKKIKSDQKITIRYEDLIEFPEKTVTALCSKIGIEFEADMMQFYSKSRYYIGDHHSKLIFKPLDSGNKKKWMKNLAAKELRIYNFIADSFLRKYGYEVGEKLKSVNDYFLMFKFFLGGLPKKINQVLKAKRVANQALAKGKALKSNSIGSMPSKKNVDMEKSKFLNKNPSQKLP